MQKCQQWSIHYFGNEKHFPAAIDLSLDNQRELTPVALRSYLSFELQKQDRSPTASSKNTTRI
jgi:hypothetical protein